MALFDGISSLFSGVKSLFSGDPAASEPLFSGQPAPPEPTEGATQALQFLQKHGVLFSGVPGVELNGITEPGIPHVDQFASKWNTGSKTYSWRWDEAVKKSRQDALAMHRDCFLQALLRERMYPTSQMSWHLEPPDKGNAEQVKVTDYLTKCIEAVPDFQEMLMSLSDALWYGRAGVQITWDWQDVAGKRSLIPREHTPVSGDKVQFTWDGIPEIWLYGGEKRNLEKRGLEIRMTDRGMMGVLSTPAWRDRFVIHKADIVDADFYESEMHGGIHGVGVRHWVYWYWWLRSELSSYIFDFLERTGTGFRVYYYDPADPNAQAKAIKIAKEQGRNTWVVWPRTAGDTGSTKGIEQFEPSTSNATVLLDILKYFDGHIERFIIGQSMSGGADNESGLGGSGRANFAKQTKQYIITHDCMKLAGTLTRDFVRVLQKYNCPDAKFAVRFVFDVDSADPEAELEAASKAFAMGVSFDADEVRGKTGFKKPSPDADIIKQQSQQPGQQPGGPPGQPAPGGPDSQDDSGDLFEGDQQATGQQAGSWYQTKGPRGGKRWVDVNTGKVSTKPPANLFGGQPTGGVMHDEKHSPPVRYSADSRRISIHAYPSETVSDLGGIQDVSRFANWCQAQTDFPDVVAFGRDGHTAEDGLGGFPEQLRAAVEPVDASQGMGEAIKAIAGKVLNMAADGAEGLVMSVDELPEPERHASRYLPVRYVAAEKPEPVQAAPAAPVAPVVFNQHIHADGITLHQPAPIVNVTVQAAEVHVPEQAAPQVTVNVPPQAAPQVTVNVPEAPVQPAPQVTVNVPPANPTPINLVLPAEKKRKKVLLYDGDGNPIGVEDVDDKGGS